MSCESDVHSPACPCLRCKPRNCEERHCLTTNHLIPQSIGRKVLGMSNNELNKYTRMESKPCHAQNDKNVPFVLQDMLKEKRRSHIVFTKETVLQIRKLGLFRA